MAILTKKFSEFVVGSLNATNKVVGLSAGANAIFDKVTTWTTATRPTTPTTAILGYNSTLTSYEFFDGTDWVQLEDGSDIATLLALLASHTAGEGASLIGLENQGSVSNKTVQDMSEAGFIVKTNNGSLLNAQAMGDLTTGIVKNTAITGVQSISAPLTSIDGLTTVANNMLYTTGANTYAVLAPVNSAVMASSLTGVPTWLGPLTDGQLIIGSTGATPVAASLTQGSGVTITPGAGTIEISATGTGGTVTQVDTGAGLTGGPINTTGTIAFATVADDRVLANISGGVAAPVANTLTAVIDACIGGTWGDILYRGTANWSVLPAGVAGEFLRTNGAGADPSWEPESGTGTVTSIAAGTGIAATPDPITTTGTIAVDGVLADMSNNVVGPNKNLIIGGNFDTNPWQRGTTFTGVSNAYTADRFGWVQSGAGVVNVLKTADAPTVADAGIFTQNCLHLDVTTADGSIGATDRYYFQYKIEGYDWAQIAQRVFTISFWVKSTKTGIFCIAFGNSGADKGYVAEYTVNTTDTWEKKTVTVTASPSAGTWLYTNGIGLYIYFTVAAGSNYQTTANAWNNGFFLSTANQVNGMDSTSNNFKLQLIQVEAGSNATGFQVRSFEEELALCQRYYEKTFNQGTAPATGVSAGGVILYSVAVAGASNRRETWTFATKKRTAPNVTYYNPVSANNKWYNNNLPADSGDPTSTFISDRHVVVNNPQVAGDLVGNYCTIHATADAEL